MTPDSTLAVTNTCPKDGVHLKTLEKIAREKKVSLAWVVREATERYIADRWPLLVVSKGD